MEANGSGLSHSGPNIRNKENLPVQGLESSMKAAEERSECGP